MDPVILHRKRVIVGAMTPNMDPGTAKSIPGTEKFVLVIPRSFLNRMEAT